MVMIIKDMEILFKCPADQFGELAQAAMMAIDREGVVLGEFVEWINYELVKGEEE